MSRVDDRAASAFLWVPRERPWRWLLAIAATVSALAHLPVISPHLAEAPYMGEEFIVLTVACLLLAVAAIVCDSAAVYSLGLLTCGLALTGYVATRLIAFPQLADDVGNWFEPLGVVSGLAESTAVLAAILGLRSRRGTRDVPVLTPTLPPQAHPRVVSVGQVDEQAESGPVSEPSWPEWRTPLRPGGS